MPLVVTEAFFYGKKNEQTSLLLRYEMMTGLPTGVVVGTGSLEKLELDEFRVPRSLGFGFFGFTICCLAHLDRLRICFPPPTDVAMTGASAEAAFSKSIIVDWFF